MLEDLDKLNTPEIPLTLHNSRAPNGTIAIVRYLIHNHLNNKRPVVNAGSFTCADLDYLLPICKPIKKPIECVDSWWWINQEKHKQQLCSEIEARYPSELIKWTWKDMSESAYIDSADYVYLSTTWTDDQFVDRINRITHSCIWTFNHTPYFWSWISKLIAEKKLFMFCYTHSLLFLTNDESLGRQFNHDILKINTFLSAWKQSLEVRENGRYSILREKYSGGMDFAVEKMNASII